MDIEDMISWILLIAAATVVLLIVTGRFLDLTIERQNLEQQRATLNLLQVIITSGPYLIADSEGNLMKSQFDKAELAKPGGVPLSKCCNSYEYDYIFRIDNQVIGTNYENKIVDDLSQAFDPRSHCYTSRGLGAVSSASTAVDVCEKNAFDQPLCKMSIADITVARTPISEISYWLGRACEEDPAKFSRGFVKNILIDPKDTPIAIDFGGRKVCTKNNICKKFACEIYKATPTAEISNEILEIQIVPELKQECNMLTINVELGKISVKGPVG